MFSRQFEDAGKGKIQRKYQCFVCGINFDTLEKMKDHILEKHEESREYLKCPVCNYPVRDIKAHFQVKHPARAIPANMQMKVSVWFDFSRDGKRRARKPKFKDGFFASEKNQKEIHYRSGYEKEVYELLEQDKDVMAFFGEPFKVPYYFEGKWSEYVPDLRVNYTDGQVQIIEVKPANQTDLDRNKAKWAAMNDHAKKLGWEFTIITEVGIGKMRTKIRHQKNS